MARGATLRAFSGPAVRVGCLRPMATSVPEEWPSRCVAFGRRGHTEPGLQTGWHIFPEFADFSGIRGIPAPFRKIPNSFTPFSMQRRSPTRVSPSAHIRPRDERTLRHIVTPSRAPFGGCVDAAERGCRLDERAGVDEGFGLFFRTQRQSDERTEAQHLCFGE